ncbi:MAG: DUF2182 domain-containing protein [Alphaproteobacteria bacterium]
MTGTALLESLLRRDRAVVIGGLVAITGLAWVYLFVTAAGMGDMSAAIGGMAKAAIAPWSALDFALMFVMWAVMMVAMMVPSAAPMILLYAAVVRKQQDKGHAFAPVSVFAAGYVVVWSAFSLGATALQWAFEQAALVSPMMVATSPLLGGVLLIAAGVYQWTPLKHACLKHCRSPLQFLSHGFRKGAGGALRMGLEHGAFCVGCCWVLMGLLFVGGVMNLLWIAGIAAFVLIEKLAPFGRHTGRVTGVALALWGIYVVVQS